MKAWELNGFGLEHWKWPRISRRTSLRVNNSASRANSPSNDPETAVAASQVPPETAP